MWKPSTRYERTINQVMGNGIMALFGAPLAHALFLRRSERSYRNHATPWLTLYPTVTFTACLRILYLPACFMTCGTRTSGTSMNDFWLSIWILPIELPGISA
jgi:hypothetical protein